MAEIDQQGPRGEAWVWYKDNVLRRLKFVFMGFGGLGAFGHMGRDLIEGLEWWVWIVDVYHNWFGLPAAALLKWVLQAPMVWIASWFDFELIPPDFPVWGVDIIVLANIAAGFLVFKRFLTIPAQLFISLMIVLSLSILFYSFQFLEVSGFLGFLPLLLFGSFLSAGSWRTQVYLVLWADRFAERWRAGHDVFLTGAIGAIRVLIFFLVTWRSNRSNMLNLDLLEPRSTARAVWKTLFTYGTILGLGTILLLLNQYADVALPPVERLLTAFDVMIQDRMSWAARAR